MSKALVRGLHRTTIFLVDLRKTTKTSHHRCIASNLFQVVVEVDLLLAAEALEKDH